MSEVVADIKEPLPPGGPCICRYQAGAYCKWWRSGLVWFLPVARAAERAGGFGSAIMGAVRGARRQGSKLPEAVCCRCAQGVKLKEGPGRDVGRSDASPAGRLQTSEPAPPNGTEPTRRGGKSTAHPRIPPLDPGTGRDGKMRWDEMIMYIPSMQQIATRDLDRGGRGGGLRQARDKRQDLPRSGLLRGGT